MKTKEITETKNVLDLEKGTSRGKKRLAFPGRVSMVQYFLKGNLHYFILCIIFSMMVSLFDMINPKIIAFTVDSIIGDDASSLPAWVNRFIDIPHLKEQLGLVALVVALLAGAAACFRYLSRTMNAKGSEHMLERTRNSLFSHILRLPFTWHNANQTGDIIQRCTSDVETMRNFVSEQLVQLFRVIILIAMALVFMVRIDPMLTLAVGVFIPIIILYSFIFHHKIGSTFEMADIEEGKLSSIAQENLTGVRVVRAFGRERYERERFEKQNAYYTSIWVRLMRILALFWSMGDVFSGLQNLTAIALGAVFCVRGNISAGSYIAFVTYNSMLMWPVRSLGRVISEMAKVGISIDRIRDIMNAEEESVQGDKCSDDLYHGDIDFNHVTFHYNVGSEENVLKDINLKIKAGTTVGILGGTGSGKSTLAYLLDRLYDLPKGAGNITIGGKDINTLDRRDLRSHIGLVLQEPFLFSRTLYENIRIALGDNDDAKLDEAKVHEAAQIASLDDTIEGFAQGYETFVGERGVTLSGGQKQRTAIAQMLIRKPPIMIFDDSLSAVDAETDSKIRHALHEHIENATVLLISHRITTLMQADQIIVLDHGRVAETGTHEELIARDGIYKKIYDLQVSQGEEAGVESEVTGHDEA